MERVADQSKAVSWPPRSNAPAAQNISFLFYFPDSWSPGFQIPFSVLSYWPMADDRW
jgi:hypothetical protein